MPYNNVYYAMANSNPSYGGNFSWAQLETSFGSKLPIHPVSWASYTYALYVDANDKPVTLYYRSSDCSINSSPPCAPFHGIFKVSYLNNPVGNGRTYCADDFDSNPATTEIYLFDK